MTEIKLDFDYFLPIPNTSRMARSLADFGATVLAARMSLSAHSGWHVLLILRERFEPLVVVALQCILGSDAKREAFNLQRVLQLKKVNTFWRKRWNRLYEGFPRPIRQSVPSVNNERS